MNFYKKQSRKFQLTVMLQREKAKKVQMFVSLQESEKCKHLDLMHHHSAVILAAYHVISHYKIFIDKYILKYTIL